MGVSKVNIWQRYVAGMGNGLFAARLAHILSRPSKAGNCFWLIMIFFLLQLFEGVANEWILLWVDDPYIVNTNQKRLTINFGLYFRQSGQISRGRDSVYFFCLFCF